MLKALIPAAGKGTRMIPITGGRAKELLPVAGRSVIERVIDEAIDAGCEQAVLINSPVKPDIDGFAALREDVVTAIQHEQHGLGHALAQAVLARDGVCSPDRAARC